MKPLPVVLGVMLALASVAVASGQPVVFVAPPPLDPPLTRAPLAPPLVVSGGFGEYRIGHFHAGFDLSTNRRVGKPVRAPETGWVERVRCSGVGYGRSVYLRAADGRTFQLGHLDAYAPAIDAYVRKAQAGDGQYEQDLWPKPNEIRVRAGDVVAWSGESGAGGPHLHFEIRRGDVAYHPQRAGLVVADRNPPAIPRITLEPLDDSSAVRGVSGPITIPLAPRADTLRAIGRLRVIVDARDGIWSGVDRMAPWSTGITWRGRTTECRFDSVSWATDMPEGDYLHDAGRVTGGKGLVLWAPAGYRPRFLRSDAPLTEEAGTLRLRPGDPPETLAVWARDLGGNEVRRAVVLRPGAAPPPARPAFWKGDSSWAEAPGDFASLPGGRVRWSLPAGLAPQGVDLQIGATGQRATRAGDLWCATFPYPGLRLGRAVRVPLAMRASSGPHPDSGGMVTGAGLDAADSLELSLDGNRLLVPAGALFEEGFLFAVRGGAGPSARGLERLSGAWRVEPSTMPLRRPARVTLAAPAGARLDRVGVCRLDGDGWSWVGAQRDSVRRAVTAETRRLGTFALFRDTTSPRIVLGRPPSRAATKPYSRWALEAAVTEEGSGVDARASWFEVDGARVPTEWDPEAGRLRWRPAHPPRRGTHRVLLVAADHAGNAVRTNGSFRVGP